MLDDYRKIYEELASNIPDYRTADRNDLVFRCAECEFNSPEYNQLLAAVIFRYWRLINKFYQQSKDIATEYDCYEWFINSITYTLNHASWKDPVSSIYKDPHAGDRMINQCMFSQRLTYYQQHNRYNRKLNYNLQSINYLTENNFDIEDTSFNTDIDFNLYISNLVSKLVSLNFYLEILILDTCLNINNPEDIQTDKTKLKRYINSIDKKYCKLIADTYIIDYAILQENLDRYKNLSYLTANKRLEEAMSNLRSLIKKDYVKELTDADRVIKYVELW